MHCGRVFGGRWGVYWREKRQMWKVHLGGYLSPNTQAVNILP